MYTKCLERFFSKQTCSNPLPGHPEMPMRQGRRRGWGVGRAYMDTARVCEHSGEDGSRDLDEISIQNFEIW